jgi:outer membrane protein, multidrug efflux system
MNTLSKKACYHCIVWFSSAMIIFFQNGCTVGPNYTQPELPAAKTDWHNVPTGPTAPDNTNPQDLAAWWTTLNDPKLTELINRAIAGNLDRKKALARVRESRARRGIALANLFPTLNATGSGTWKNATDKGERKTTESFSTGFDAKWEIDIFGGTRRSIEAADADLQAAQEGLHDVLVSLLAETALNYIEIRSYQSRITTVEDNIKLQAETYELTLWRNQAGLSDELAVQEAKYNLENTRSQIPTLHTNLEEAMNRIAVLLGQQPGSLHGEFRESQPIPIASSALAIGVPADMIRRRPDIRQAERELAAQTARVGVATADLYPKLNLTGAITVDAPSFNKLTHYVTSSDHYVFGGGPGVSWAVFDGGAIRQNIAVQSAIQEQALIQYESSVLSAVEEVENALVSYTDEQQRMENLRQAAEAAKTAAELSQEEYQAGMTDFVNVLVAQRSQLSFQDQLVQSKSTAISNLIRLYKALGGGWTSFAQAEEQNIVSGDKNDK